MPTQKKTVISCLAILLAMSGLYLYFRQPPPVSVGFIANLSGRNSQLGVSARNGAQLAVEEINQHRGINGRKLVLHIRDNQGNREECLTVTEELLNNGVNVVVGPFTSVMAEPVLAATTGKNTLILSPTVSSDRLTGIDDHFLRLIGAASQQGRKLAEAALSRGDSLFSIVTDLRNREYTESVSRGFKEGLANSAGKIILELSFLNKSDFQDLARKLAAAGPDGVLFAASGIDTAGIIQQYHKLSTLPHLYASTWSKATRVHEYGGKAVEGMVLVAGHENKVPGEQEKTFTEKYARYYRSEPDFASTYTYEALQLLGRAAIESGGFNPAVLKRTILGMDSIQGVREQYRLDPFGDAVRGLSLFTIHDGSYVLVETP